MKKLKKILGWNNQDNNPPSDPHHIEVSKDDDTNSADSEITDAETQVSEDMNSENQKMLDNPDEKHPNSDTSDTSDASASETNDDDINSADSATTGVETRVSEDMNSENQKMPDSPDEENFKSDTSGESAPETGIAGTAIGEDAANVTETELTQHEEAEPSSDEENIVEILEWSSETLQREIEILKKTTSQILTAIENLEQPQDESGFKEAYQNLSAEYSSLQEKLRGYERGYDEDFEKKHISHFVQIDQDLFKEISDRQTKSDHDTSVDVLTTLEQYQVLLRDALANSEVIPFTPSIGEYVGASEEIEIEQPIDCEDEGKRLTVAEDGIISPGYKINGVLLRKAKVRAYRHTQKDQQ